MPRRYNQIYYHRTLANFLVPPIGTFVDIFLDRYRFIQSRKKNETSLLNRSNLK